MACTCGYPGICSEHPRCPWCGNYVTVFASGLKEWRCTRCKKVFTKKTTVVQPTDVNPPSTQKASKESTMKKTTKSAKSVKSVVVAKKSVKRAERESHLQYDFVKMTKDAPEEETAYGVVLVGIRKIKSGNLDDATEAALKAGLAKVSSQDPRAIARKGLRMLANIGIVRISRDGEEKGGNAKKATGAKKGSKKSFKLVKK